MSEVLKAVKEQRLVAIIRAADPVVAEATGRALLGAGVRALEVSLVTPDALGVIGRLVRDAEKVSAFVGAGTVLSATQVEAAAEVGAAFVVSPVSDPATVRRTKELGLLSCPGVATPSEGLAVAREGADLLKLFPASVWSPGSLRDWLTAMPDLQVVPTGGISLADAGGWITAGAAAVGMGSALTGGDPGDVAPRVAPLLARLEEAR